MITVVFGKPGCGKTAYMTADALQYIDGSAQSLDLLSECVTQIMALREEGYVFLPPRHAPVYSNYPIRFQAGLVMRDTFYVDGFHLGLENSYLPVIPVLPSARIYLAEAQRYYNSRRSKDLPSWVSRFYEEHRHFGLNIFLDVQRPGLIDLNIRELVSRFVEPLRLDHHRDEAGNIVSTTFHLREFDDWKHVEAYIDGTGARYKDTTFCYDGNVFAAYKSTSYYKQFVPAYTDFSQLDHVYGNSADELELIKQMYLQTPPEGYYDESKSERKKVKRYE